MEIKLKSLGWVLFLTFSITACSDNDTDVFNGYVEANLTYLSSPYGGKLKTLPIARGDSVKSNQVLFELDTSPEFLDLEAAKSQVEESLGQLNDLKTGARPSEIDSIKAQINQVEKELAFFKHEYERHKKLIKNAAISQQSYDQVEKNYLAAKAQLENLQAQLVTAKLPARAELINAANARVSRNKSALSKATWVLQQKKNMAPKDGYIYDTYYHVGEYVPLGMPIVSILIPDEVKTIFYVPEKSLNTIRLNQPVILSCDGCKEKISARIDFISQIAEFTPPVIYSQKTREKLVFRVEATFDQKDTLPLLPGQPVDIRILAKETA